jgi:hypothetical protein
MSHLGKAYNGFCKENSCCDALYAFKLSFEKHKECNISFRDYGKDFS